MEKLTEIMKKWQTNESNVGHGDKNTIHTYGSIYEALLEKYRKNCTFLEIGIASGRSLEVWHEYFIDSKIYGLEIDDSNIKNYLNDSRFLLNINDATNPECLKNYENIKFDVIIDDGSHLVDDQIKTYNLFKNYLKKDALYIIEDVDLIENYHDMYKNLDANKDITIIDLRLNKYRYDDVLIIIKDK